jgi:hypothetical protein
MGKNEKCGKVEENFIPNDKIYISYFSNTLKSVSADLAIEFDIIKVPYCTFNQLFYHSCAQNFHLDLVLS